MTLIQKTSTGIKRWKINPRTIEQSISNVLIDECQLHPCSQADQREVNQVIEKLLQGKKHTDGFNQTWSIDPIIDYTYHDERHESPDYTAWINKMIKQGASCFRYVNDDDGLSDAYIVASRWNIPQRQAEAFIRRESKIEGGI